jgi:hypothetical protein
VYSVGAFSKATLKFYNIPEIISRIVENDDVVYEIRRVKQAVLKEKFEEVVPQVKELESFYGPSYEWVDGNRHTPTFIENAIARNDTDALACLKYLWKKVYVAQKIEKSDKMSQAKSPYDRRKILCDACTEMREEVEKCAKLEFKHVEELVREIQSVRRTAQMDEILARYQAQQ